MIGYPMYPGNLYAGGYNPNLSPQQRLNMMQQQYMDLPQQQNMSMQGFQSQNQMGMLKGRAVTSYDEAKAAMIDLDGSLHIFPDLANGKIYTKQINLDGTASLIEYRRVENKEKSTSTPNVDINAVVAYLGALGDKVGAIYDRMFGEVNTNVTAVNKSVVNEPISAESNVPKGVTNGSGQERTRVRTNG